jgi:hypothetical protein
MHKLQMKGCKPWSIAQGHCGPIQEFGDFLALRKMMIHCVDGTYNQVVPSLCFI